MIAPGVANGVGQGADWPTYRADAARSGYTPEALPDGLALGWSHRAAHPPMPAWPGSDRMQFDRAYQPVVAGGTVYYGSSADGRVVALDAATGAVRWMHFTDGPVRFAPVVSEGRVFVAGDDGWLVCLAATDGKVLWRLRGGPKDDMLLGNGRMISRWPARGGPAVADGVLYFAAGIWPSEGVYVYAVDPATGKVRWCNDSSGALDMPQPHPGANARSGVAAQGYLAVRGPELLVSTGRAVPAVFDREKGGFQSFPLQAYGHLGGADVVAFDGQTFNHGMLYSAVQGVKPQTFGPQVAVHPQWVVSCAKDKLRVYDRGKLWVDSTATDRKGNQTATKALGQPAWTIQLPHPAEAALIIAGQQAVAGGAGQVSVVDLVAKKVVWTGQVEGTAYGLAAAQGRLYVSTDRGRLYCFQSAGLPAVQPQEPTAAASHLSRSAPFSAAAEEILRRTGVREGYCLDLGCGDGRLALELAQRSKLHIYAVDENAANVEAARQRLDAAGLYGTRVTVHRADPRKLPHPKWFADLIVSGRSVTAATAEVAADAVRHCQRPCGGAVCVGKAGAMKVSVRGPLDGAGDWTHQYADAANSLCSSDVRLRGPLGMLWFRDTDLNMPNRHGRGPAPLIAAGRMFVEGADALRAVSIYNGRTLWKYPLPGILRAYHQDHLMGSAGTGSNYCLAGDRIYLAAGDRCLGLSTAEGRKVSEWRAPPQPDGKPGTWGLIACDGRTLLGSLVDQRHLVKYRYLNSDMSRLFKLMGEVTPGKMLALCECQGLPNPEIMAKDGPRWLYCLPWYVGKDQKWNPPDWVKKVHAHEVYVTLDRLPKWTKAGAAAKVPAADELLSFVAEMERLRGMDVRGNARQWTDAERAKFAAAVRLAADEWKRRIPEIKPQLTAEKVRSLSRWAKPQMEQYKAVPALDKVTLQPVGSDAQQEKLVLEGTIDTLPSHSPVVTRWLKVYLLYDLNKKSVARIVITIRGERLE